MSENTSKSELRKDLQRLSAEIQYLDIDESELMYPDLYKKYLANVDEEAGREKSDLMRVVRLRDLVNNVRELESNSNSKNWTNKITGIRLLVEQYADEIEEGSGAKSIKEIEKKLQCLQDEFKNRDSELDGHCQSKRLKLLTKIETLKWVLSRAT